MRFPAYRARRLRERQGWRRLVQETTLSPSDFIYPMFITPGSRVRQEISSLPGQYHLSADMAVEEVKDVADHGIPAVLLFGLPESKDAIGREAYSDCGRGATGDSGHEESRARLIGDHRRVPVRIHRSRPLRRRGRRAHRQRRDPGPALPHRAVAR